MLKNDKRLALRLDSSGPIPQTPTGIADVTMSSIALGCLLSELKADPNTIITYGEMLMTRTAFFTVFGWSERLVTRSVG